MQVLKCENLSASYGTQKVFENLSFGIEAGECVAVLGENGAGKSTLLRCILGLLKQDDGSVRLNGLSHKETGYLPQQSDEKNDFPATVFEVVLSGCLNKRGFLPFYSKKEKSIANEALEILNIKDLKKKNYSSLSGGQRQKVNLARALCTADKLLILDEPTSSLDIHAASEMYELIDTLKRTKNMAILMVSHDAKSALLASEKVLHLSGNGYFFGTKDEYLKSPFYKFFTGVSR